MAEPAAPAKPQRQSFVWPLPYEFTASEAREFRLIKGVAATEGVFKDRRNQGKLTNLTRDNIIAAAGALRSSALLGWAMCNIDHYWGGLPDEYAKKYGKEIADPYPPVFIIDAQAVQNTMPDKTVKYQIEWIGACTNELVYDMIGKGMFVGNSIEDYVRDVMCSDRMCEYGGSAVLDNALILMGVPNSDGTWVSQVTEKDVGTVVVSMSAQRRKSVLHQYGDSKVAKAGIRAKLERHIAAIRGQAPTIADTATAATAITHAAEEPAAATTVNVEPSAKVTSNDDNANPHSIDDYYTDGQWVNGLESVYDYLREEKEITDEDLARQIALYIFENPGKLDSYQLENLSQYDIVMWWRHIKDNEALRVQLSQLQKHVAVLAWLDPNRKAYDDIVSVTGGSTDDPGAEYEPVIKLAESGYKEVPTGAGKGDGIARVNNCSSCKWFARDHAAADGTGHCVAASQPVDVRHVCDQWTPIIIQKSKMQPELQGAPETQASPPDPATPAAPPSTGKTHVNVPTGGTPHALVDAQGVMEGRLNGVTTFDASHNTAVNAIQAQIDQWEHVLEQNKTVMPGRGAAAAQYNVEHARSEIARLEEAKKKLQSSIGV